MDGGDGTTVSESVSVKGDLTRGSGMGIGICRSGSVNVYRSIPKIRNIQARR